VHRLDGSVVAHCGNSVVLTDDPNSPPRSPSAQDSAERGLHPRHARVNLEASIPQPPYQLRRARVLLVRQFRMRVDELDNLFDDTALGVNSSDHFSIRKGHAANANASARPS
jgi:hypothetical protein